MSIKAELRSNGVVNIAYVPHTTEDAGDLPKWYDEVFSHLTDDAQSSQQEQVKDDSSRPPRKESREGQQEGDVPDGGWGWVVAVGAALIMFIYNFSGPLLGPLLAEFSWRSVALPSGLLAAASLALSAFAGSAEFLIFSYSIVGGLSCGLLNNLCYLIVPHYFCKRRGIANAILVTGVSCGPIFGPLLVRYLQESLGFKGATLITGAVVFNACVGASVFRPIHKDSGDSKKSKKLCGLILRVICSTVTNVRVLKSPRAVIIAVSGALTLNSWLNFLTLVPFAVQAAGYSFQEAAWCVTASAVCILIASLGISLLSDFKFFNMRISCMVSTAIIAASILAFSFIDDITLLIVVMGVWGLGVGGYMGTYNLVIVKYMGIEKLIPTFGVTLMLVGLCFITIGPSIGLIRDMSQSYAVSMYVLSGMAFVCSVLWNFMPAAVRYDQRKENERNGGE
ncbi:monocarboxylate transporter 12-B isoform X2 [Penaeus vannamei]|uniref:monocarboxylate transporter 12-B isoform X2 n=1 Tax=Penaeus vannamei TaxID=6689 RepID=UPI00387F4E24